MSLFKKEKEISLSRLKKTIREDPGFVPRSGARLRRSERTGLVENVFGARSPQSSISEREFRSRLRDLELEAHDAASWEEKEKLQNRHRYLKKFL